MELRHLHYFLTVAEELHFGRAAERLQMTQPPLSQQIRQLEAEVGVDLFKRSKRHVELTIPGKVFLKEVKQIIEHLDIAVENAQRAERGEFGNVIVGFVGSATYDILPDIVREFRLKYPKIAVSLHELSTPDQIRALNRKEIDVGLLHPPINDPLIETKTIQQGAAALAFPKNHPLAKKEVIEIEDLIDIPFVVVSRDIWPGLYDEFVSAFHDASFTPNIVQEATEYQMVIGLVQAGIGIGVLPKTAEKLFNLDIVYREIEHHPLNTVLALAHRKDDYSPALANFLQLASEVAEETKHNQ
ncbi:acetoin biosynthesis transcriptional regulator AlsR [Heyndrickxia ginsengihumi]|uniref:LysR family transcriptional regulator n=1 Tax=Heyndrickxia ginsengihumi TaxID=363870 RepID=A0A0A6VCF7_9BACI|nr:LysR family transcriptional regulator [Heyndrickxia ginsengihumi]KHD85246.1 LysR family transcriptional regulator [Heyndrickxia ginsengihumi]MBE6184563.1 LysR family transcriptional regulator [Bacillus sp. (in: firmicutes)]MCM3024486.1 LysR family transcriptional regulator [Heyndrickxia ginsengihumi]